MGRPWTNDGVVVGYVITDVVDAHAHIEQLSVEREHQGQGHGKALMAQAEAWADGEGFEMASLTTFSEVDGTGLYTSTSGHSVWPEAELSPGIKAIRESERERGIEPPERVAKCESGLFSRTRSD